MTKKERRIFDCVSFEDWQEIVGKHTELAKKGSIASTYFLFNRVFGLAKVKERKKNGTKEQLKINFVYNE